MQDGSVQLWYVASGTQSQMQGYEAKVSATEWSGNGRYLATAAGSSLVVWDFSGKGPEGSRPIELRSHSERISALACRPDRHVAGLGRARPAAAAVAHGCQRYAAGCAPAER